MKPKFKVGQIVRCEEIYSFSPFYAKIKNIKITGDDINYAVKGILSLNKTQPQNMGKANYWYTKERHLRKITKEERKKILVEII